MIRRITSEETRLFQWSKIYRSSRCRDTKNNSFYSGLLLVTSRAQCCRNLHSKADVDFKDKKFRRRISSTDRPKFGNFSWAVNKWVKSQYQIKLQRKSSFKKSPCWIIASTNIDSSSNCDLLFKPPSIPHLRICDIRSKFPNNVHKEGIYDVMDVVMNTDI